MIAELLPTLLPALRYAWRFRFPLAIAALVAGVALWLHAEQSAAELRGTLRERSRVADSAIHAVRIRKAIADTVWRHDSLTFAHTDTAYSRTADTVRLRDTLYVRKDVADDALRAGEAAVIACSCALAESDSLLALERARPTATADTVRAIPLREKAKWAVLGAGAFQLVRALLHR